MPRLDCDGNGNVAGCAYGVQLKSCKITNLSNNEINTADAGDTIKLWVEIYAPHFPCDNFVIDYDFDGTVVGCYADSLGYNSTWNLAWQYTIPIDTSAGLKDIYFREMLTGTVTCFAPLYIYAAGCEQYTAQSTCEAAGCYWYNGACHQSYPACNSLNQTDCNNFDGCWWYDGSCHPAGCSFINNQTTCEDQGCYWWSDNTCRNVPEDITCENITDEFSCWQADCYWYNGSCHSNPRPCADWTIQWECENAGCYWYNGSCHSSTPSCSQIDNQSDCLTFGCYWCNGYCQSTPCGGGPQIVFRIGLSTFYATKPSGAPFEPGGHEKLVQIWWENVGTTTSSLIHIKTYAYPGQATEVEIDDTVAGSYAPGEIDGMNIYGDIPLDATNPLPLGIKIWDVSETEPSW